MPICASCGRENPDGFAFCGFCTAPLGSQPPPPLEERKIVSVLFCDLVGFTETSEQQDPEDVRARIRPYHARLRQEIERYGGTVEKFVGDAVMAAFGAPVAHEDDPLRAVQSGLRILEAIAELNAADASLGLQVRVGINTGEAVVVVGARPERGEGIVTGDVVNTASRIQEAAPVNTVVVGEQTYRATSRTFDYEPLAPVAVKGKSEPLLLWQAKSARARFGSDVARDFKTPLVGRELEKPLLIGTFERAAQQRSMQLVTVVGEPGVGKSRLIAELAAYTDAKPGIFRWRQGRCLPYGEGITFWALGEIVKAEAGILESDSAQLAASKLDAAISPDEPERQWLLQRLAPLVGAEASSPAERQELFTAWRRFLESLAAARPTVLVFEDLHWADDALLAFLEHLSEWSHGVPLLVLCAARPELYERRPGWGAGQRNAHTINLSPLSDQETAELIRNLVSTTLLDPDLEDAVLERAGGNPLYAEEFVRLLNDQRLSADGTALPESIQALIAARLDTLPPERKSLLQDAAVVGKVFWAGALAEMGSSSENEVELALHELARKELVRPSRTTSMEGETEYAFWHVLIRDVAYSQIPRGERARRHRAAAAWIERKAGERVEDLAEVLAYHYLQALELAEASGEAEQARELAQPARRFLALAGERALGLDTVQAEARLARALELTPAEDPERPHLLVRWADAAWQAGRLREAVDALEDGLEELRKRGDAKATAHALQLRSRAAIRRGEGRMVEFAAEAVALLKQTAPDAELVDAYAQLANANWIVGAYEDSVSAAERAMSLAKRLGVPEPARAHGYRGFARTFLGDADGLAEMKQGLAMLVEQGVGRDAATLQNNIGFASYPIVGPSQALATFEDGIAFCRERGLVEPTMVLDVNCINLLVELGRIDEALERAQVRASASDASGDIHTLCEVRAIQLAICCARGEEIAAGETDWLIDTARTISAADVFTFVTASAATALAPTAGDRALALLSAIEQTPGTRETPYYPKKLPEMVRTALAVGDRDLAAQLMDGIRRAYPLDEHAHCSARAQLSEHDRDYGGAVHLYADAAARWDEFGNVPERAYALLGEGRCLRALGDPLADEPLNDAHVLFTAMGYRPALEETERLLESTAAPTT